jgi:excisionase family DNA binding protein
MSDPLTMLAELVDEVAALRSRVDELERNGAGGPVRAWLTLDEAGERLGVSADAVRMRARRGRLEHRRHGRRLYVSATSVDRLA